MNWIINSLSIINKPLPETAVMANFTIEKDTYSVSYSVNLLPATVAKFTPYAKITEDMAIAWVKAALGDSRVIAMEAEVDEKIAEAAMNSLKIAPLPWL
jgi:hypothetical protein